MRFALLLAAAGGLSPYDPSDYIAAREDPHVAATLSESRVMLNGRPYLRLGSNVGAILVPDVFAVSRESLERSHCVVRHEEPLEDCVPEDAACFDRNRARVRERAPSPAARAEVSLSATTKIYAEMILATIQKKCGIGEVTPPIALDYWPEVGIEIKGKQSRPERTPTTYKIFHHGLQKALGVGAEW